MADKKIELRVIAPTMATDQQPYKFHKDVDMVIMRCVTGDFGVLPGRVPCSMVLDTGVLRVYDEGSESHVAILGGVAHVGDDVVTILSEAAMLPGDVNIEKVKSEQKETERLFNETSDLHEKQAYRTTLRRHQVLLDVAGSVGR